MPEQRIYELIARKLSGEASPAELEELAAYLQAHGNEQYVYEILASYWEQHPDWLGEDAREEEERFQRILQASSPTDAAPAITEAEEVPVKTVPLRRWLAYAAIFVALAGSAYFLYWYHKGGPTGEPDVVAGQQPLKEVVARAGSRSKLVLPDGTLVWLNAESRISYNNDFNTAQREVNLEGEAFFDVAHNAQKPFIVHTSGIDIKVLGTAFNVKSYATDETIETTLLRGSVEVVKKNDPAAPKIILRPHEKLVFNRAELKGRDVVIPSSADDVRAGATAQPGILVTALPRNKPDSIIKETSWLYNKLNFDGDSFEELAAKMERWYDVKITIENNRLKHSRLKGSFENETLREALEALRVIKPFEYAINGREIVIQ